MKINVIIHCATLSGVFCWPLTTFAGVRHSRGLGGVGQPIPRTDQRPPSSQNNIPQQEQQPAQQFSLPNSGQPQPANQPMVVPPPVPLQVPTQMSFEPPIQLPQTGQPTAAPSTQAPQQEQLPALQLPPQQVQQPVPQFPPQQELQPIPQQGVPTLPPLSAGGAPTERYVLPSYGMAGCGLGSMIFNNNVRSQQWLASILNDILIPQSIMISTGTSNCVDVDEEQIQAEQEVFIDTNLHALRLESARGEGESLRALADLMGCRQDGLFDAFASSSQGQHSFIFSDSQPAAIAERYRDVLKRSRALKKRCERLF